MNLLPSPTSLDGVRDKSSFGTFHAPLVSIIVINHNYGEYLFACLSSIDCQTYSNIQCIFVDNASTDSTPEELKRVDERKLFTSEGRSFEVIRYDTNLHQTSAAARTISSARGSFVMFFDADDHMLPECIETHIQALLSSPLPVGASCSDYYMSNHDDLVTSTVNSELSRQFVGKRRKDILPSFRIVPLPGISKQGSVLLKSSAVRHVNQHERGWPWSGIAGLCFRRELVELLLRRVPNLQSQLDSYLIKGVNCLTGSILINRPLVIYRSHGRNIFARGPTLVGLNFYDARAIAKAEANVVTEVLKTLVYIADYLASRMEVGTYLDAVVAVLACPPNARNTAEEHLTFRHFLKQNEEALVNAFGHSILESRLCAGNICNIGGNEKLLRPPLLSFIVINFNYGRFLEKCIASIMAQSYAYIECIVVDNASSDDSDAILRQLERQYPYLRVIRNSTNLGQIGGCREGFRIASGQFVAFVDADDYLLSNFAERHIAVHVRAPKSVGFTSSDMLQEVGGAVVRASYMSELRQADDCIAPKIAIPVEVDRGSASPQAEILAVNRECVDWVWSPTSGNVYRSELVRLFIECRHNAKIKTGADAFFNYPINALSGSLIIREALAVYRIHASNEFSNGAMLGGLKCYHKDADPAYLVVLNSLRHISENFSVFAESTDRLALSGTIRILARKVRRLPSPLAERYYLFMISIFLSAIIRLSSRKLNHFAFKGRFMVGQGRTSSTSPH